MKADKIKQKYSEFLKGKKVALIGPSKYTKNTNQRELIDSYDIVVRMNLGYKFPDKIKKDIGTRTDVLYCSFSNYFFKRKLITKKNFGILKNKHGIKWMVGTGHHRGNMIKLKKINIGDYHIPITIVDRNDFKYVASKMKNKITSGIITIFDLLKHDIKELYISGFTFYNITFPKKDRKKYYYSQYMPDYRYKILTPFLHDNKGELKYFKQLYKKDKRIKCDNILKEILKTNE